jgi:hypothetical protein
MGWFKRPIKNLADFKGLKCRQTGIVSEIYQRMGMQTVNMPGGEIVPSAQRGVIDCAEWVGGIEDLRLGLPQVWKYHYTPGMHESNSMLEIIINTDTWKGLTPQQQESYRAATFDTFVRWGIRWCDRRDAHEVRHAASAHAAGDPGRFPEDLGQDGRRGIGEEPVLQEGARLAARVRGQGGPGQALHVPALFVRGELLLPRDGEKAGRRGRERKGEVASADPELKLNLS